MQFASKPSGAVGGRAKFEEDYIRNTHNNLKIDNQRTANSKAQAEFMDYQDAEEERKATRALKLKRAKAANKIVKEEYAAKKSGYEAEQVEDRVMKETADHRIQSKEAEVHAAQLKLQEDNQTSKGRVAATIEQNKVIVANAGVEGKLANAVAKLGLLQNEYDVANLPQANELYREEVHKQMDDMEMERVRPLFQTYIEATANGLDPKMVYDNLRFDLVDRARAPKKWEQILLKRGIGPEYTEQAGKAMMLFASIGNHWSRKLTDEEHLLDKQIALEIAKKDTAAKQNRSLYKDPATSDQLNNIGSYVQFRAPEVFDALGGRDSEGKMSGELEGFTVMMDELSRNALMDNVSGNDRISQADVRGVTLDIASHFFNEVNEQRGLLFVDDVFDAKRFNYIVQYALADLDTEMTSNPQHADRRMSQLWANDAPRILRTLTEDMQAVNQREDHAEQDRTADAELSSSVEKFNMEGFGPEQRRSDNRPDFDPLFTEYNPDSVSKAAPGDAQSRMNKSLKDQDDIRSADKRARLASRRSVGVILKDLNVRGAKSRGKGKRILEYARNELDSLSPTDRDTFIRQSRAHLTIEERKQMNEIVGNL